MRNTASRTTIKQTVALILALLLLMPGIALAQNNFSSGTVRFSGSASGSSGYRGSNLQVGLGVGYYVADGLELGLDARSWIGAEQNIYELEPSITYVLPNLGPFRAYGGVLYRRTFVSARDDQSAFGGRGGIFLQQSRNLHIRAGLVGIRYLDCDSSVNSDCSSFYPEVAAGFYF